MENLIGACMAGKIFDSGEFKIPVSLNSGLFEFLRNKLLSVHLVLA